MNSRSSRASCGNAQLGTDRLSAGADRVEPDALAPWRGDVGEVVARVEHGAVEILDPGRQRFVFEADIPGSRRGGSRRRGRGCRRDGRVGGGGFAFRVAVAAGGDDREAGQR